MKKTLLTFILTALFACDLLATGFSNVTVVPANPSITDTIKISYKYVTASRPARVHTHQITSLDSFVYIDVCFGMGQQTSGATFYDTVNIGVYPLAGNYHVTLYMNLTSLLDTLCTNSMWYDSAEVFFTVAEPTGINGRLLNESFAISPNPANGKLFCSLNSKTQSASIQITSIEGKPVLSNIPITPPNFEIDVSALPVGIYFLQLSDERQRLVRRFVKY